MVLNEIISAYGNYFNVDFNTFLLRIFTGLALILAGIFLGKIIAYSLKKIFKKIEIEKNMRPSFINLIIAVIQWATYIIFIDLALVQLPIPGLTGAITKVLVVIPALVGALILIVIGFAIAVYLREVVEDSEITGWKILSSYLFYFILYVFGIYALKIALVSLDSFVVNILLMLITAIVGISTAYFILLSAKRNISSSR